VSDNVKMDQNTSSQSDIDEIESLFHISVQPATLEVPQSVAPARKPSSPPTIPVSAPLLPPSSVSSSSQAFSTPAPPGPSLSTGVLNRSHLAFEIRLSIHFLSSNFWHV
jgi:hypothetical protein